MKFGINNRRPILGMKPVDQRAVRVRVGKVTDCTRGVRRGSKGNNTVPKEAFELGGENQPRKKRKATGKARSVLDDTADRRKDLGEVPAETGPNQGLAHNHSRPPKEQRHKGNVEEPEQ